MFKKIIETVFKPLIKKQALNAVEYAEGYFKTGGQGEAKKKIAINYVLSFIKLPAILKPAEIYIQEQLSGLVDVLIEKAVLKMKGLIK